MSPPLAESEATTESVGWEAWLGVPMATMLSVALAGEPEFVPLVLVISAVVVFVVLIVVVCVVLRFVVVGDAVVVEEIAPVVVAAASV